MYGKYIRLRCSNFDYLKKITIKNILCKIYSFALHVCCTVWKGNEGRNYTEFWKKKKKRKKWMYYKLQYQRNTSHIFKVHLPKSFVGVSKEKKVNKIKYFRRRNKQNNKLQKCTFWLSINLFLWYWIINALASVPFNIQYHSASVPFNSSV